MLRAMSGLAGSIPAVIGGVGREGADDAGVWVAGVQVRYVEAPHRVPYDTPIPVELVQPAEGGEPEIGVDARTPPMVVAPGIIHVPLREQIAHQKAFGR